MSIHDFYTNLLGRKVLPSKSWLCSNGWLCSGLTIKSGPGEKNRWFNRVFSHETYDKYVVPCEIVAVFLDSKYNLMVSLYDSRVGEFASYDLRVLAFDSPAKRKERKKAIKSSAIGATNARSNHRSI